MCQHCIESGRMTQAEMDAAVLSGDNTVVPIMDLPVNLFLEAIAEVSAEAIAAGMPLAEARQVASGLVLEYALREALREASDDA